MLLPRFYSKTLATTTAFFFLFVNKYICLSAVLNLQAVVVSNEVQLLRYCT